MSVSNQTNKVSTAADGVTTAFSFSFKIFDSSELYVYTIAANGTVTGPLTITTDYTLSINSVSEGGIVTFVVAPASGKTVFIKRIVPLTQSAVITSEGPLPGPQIENQLDLMTMMAIQIGEKVDRAITVPATFTGSIPSLPIPQDGYAIGWDGTTGLMQNLLVDSDAISNAVAAAAAAATTATTQASAASTSASSASTQASAAATSAVAAAASAASFVSFVDRGDPSGEDFTSFTKDSAYHDLDLSGIVPAGAKAVLLSLLISNDTSAKEFLLRKKGNSNNVNVIRLWTQVSNVSFITEGIVSLSTGRVIQYNFQNSGTWGSCSISVRGWFL